MGRKVANVSMRSLVRGKHDDSDDGNNNAPTTGNHRIRHISKLENPPPSPTFHDKGHRKHYKGKGRVRDIPGDEE